MPIRIRIWIRLSILMPIQIRIRILSQVLQALENDLNSRQCQSTLSYPSSKRQNF